MLARESVRVRLESEHGISFTEFSYMLLQANDYLWLHDHMGCELQMGGSDQWGNIVSGVDLIRRKRQVAVHALAWPLLMAADGTKLGKTTGARLWLDPAKTSPYQFHQHWMQLDDQELEQQFMFFSLRPLPEIAALLAEHATAPERRLAQRALADEVTALVHGEAAARAAGEAADLLFGADPLGASPEALATLGRRGAVEPGHPDRPRATSWSCWPPPGWHRRRATLAGSSSRERAGERRGRRNGRRHADVATPARPLPAGAEGKAVVPPCRDFFADEVDGPAARR